jgi:hypothetical protein
MAEKKAATKRAKAKARPGKAKAKVPASRKATKTRSTAKPRKRSAGNSRPAASKPKTPAGKSAPSKPQVVLETVEEAAKDAGGKVASVATKAKVPLLAGGAALAGAAGGLALGARQAHHKSGLGKVSSKDLTKAAKKVGEVGAQVGEVALEVRRARESTNGNGKAHRSPIEVVLQGLTSRRPRA